MGHSRLIILDGLRGVAALAVLIYHLRLDIFAGLERGYLMVDLFFVLSGFVLARSFEPRLRADLSWQEFLWQRVKRLWPVILAGVAIGLASFLIRDHMQMSASGWLTTTVMAIFLLPTIWVTRDPALFPLNRPHWSLFLELLANVLHSVLLVRLGTRLLAILLLLLAPALAFAAWRAGDMSFGGFQSGWYLGLLRVGYCYIAGIIIARMLDGAGPRASLPWYAILILPLFVLLLTEAAPIWLGDALTVIIAFPAILWLGAFSAVPSSARPALAIIGAISYPLYATHFPIVQLFRAFAPSESAKYLALAATILVALAIAWLLDRKRLKQRMQESRTAASD